MNAVPIDPEPVEGQFSENIAETAKHSKLTTPKDVSEMTLSPTRGPRVTKNQRKKEKKIKETTLVLEALDDTELKETAKGIEEIQAVSIKDDSLMPDQKLPMNIHLEISKLSKDIKEYSPKVENLFEKSSSSIDFTDTKKYASAVYEKE